MDTEIVVHYCPLPTRKAEIKRRRIPSVDKWAEPPERCRRWWERLSHLLLQNKPAQSLAAQDKPSLSHGVCQLKGPPSRPASSGSGFPMGLPSSCRPEMRSQL